MDGNPPPTSSYTRLLSAAPTAASAAAVGPAIPGGEWLNFIVML